MIRTAIALVGATGAATAALMLHRSSAATRMTTPSLDTPVACGTPAPSHAQAKLSHGKLDAQMSAGKLLRNGGGEAFAAFQLTTDNVAGQRPPLDLAIVIDPSGSMSDGRLDHAKSAAIGIITKLGTEDHVALIQYDDGADVVFQSAAMDPRGKEQLMSAIQGLSLGGGTNLFAGMQLGRQEVERVHADGQVNRVILLSDGHANSGVVDTPSIAEGARQAANNGVRITSVGIGLDFNEDLMEAIAEAGRGNYHYVKEASDLDRVVAEEMAGIQTTVATNVELRLTPVCAGVQIAEVHGYESKRDGNAFVVPMADLAGNDSRKLLVSLKVPANQNGNVAALHGELVYRDAKGTELRKANVDLGLEISSDTAAVNASVNSDVMAQALQLQAAASMRQAAQAYEAGDQAGAASIIESSTRDIEQKSAHYNIEAKTADTRASLGEMQKKALEYKPGSYEGKDMLKSSKSKARVMSKK
ncbi:MAG TPA: VWA domain-containing protein [Kofleriaceae bacterium]|nr:VWA domain-containing protein [Kofleriaceae bacterium]